MQAALDGVDVTDGVQPLSGQQHVVVLGNRAGHQRRASALDGDVDRGAAAHPQHLGHLVDGPGTHQHTGVAAVAAGVVDAVGGKYVGIGADMLSTHHPHQLLQHACGHGVEVSHGAQ